jgi:hypothetical protein
VSLVCFVGTSDCIVQERNCYSGVPAARCRGTALLTNPIAKPFSMPKKSLNQGGVSKNLKGNGSVTRAMVNVRAHELTLIAGRTSPDVTQADYEQAKRELTGESDLDRQEAILDSIPEAKRWDPIPGSEGHRSPESPSEEGRNA